jgi:hypothetical protein
MSKQIGIGDAVAKVILTKGIGLLEGRTITKVMLDAKHMDLPAGTQLYTHAQNASVDELVYALEQIAHAKSWQGGNIGYRELVHKITTYANDALAKHKN